MSAGDICLREQGYKFIPTKTGQNINRPQNGVAAFRYCFENQITSGMIVGIIESCESYQYRKIRLKEGG